MNLEQELKNQFVIPVIRHQDEKDLLSLCEALIDGGLKILEVTLMSDSAFNVINQLSKRSDIIIAAGTVLSVEQAKRSIDAGAKFLVSPGLNIDAVQVALQNKTPFIPGCLTPTEVMAAKETGCDTVKIFPISSVGGISYIKNLQGPFPSMKWMATGGITLEDIPAYKKSGVTCIGLGGNLTPQDMIASKNWKMISQNVQLILKQI